ncbi:MAG TPA: ornithine carbamoyltransferase [Candidatus Sumerlaeota bacterium]|nr:MAG: N-acetylornithine carbamoyltransferase [candidate division BRC1 bacterium ADurb.Bin183]HOE64377.1 ornithine carbamoyltransferase [Candidatus Sumerlaeota bacterium]HRR31737.1 ornithine carbamoyltransferase [Candidatus Sumerlaeia bacterium]HON51166.1 ornithine carbamoyltransferase [Candidatus Sumerlaeota bacterium]HOR64955.1 ornithine carbamoyltransferase [Candidatus Sumerlaeota bacterium]
MKQSLKGRDYITTQEWSVDDLEEILEMSHWLKDRRKQKLPQNILNDKTIFLLFFDKSTRTRNSFEAGITQLGGHAHFIDSETSQIAHGETAQDTGVILSRYGEGIAIRHDLVPYEGNAYMREVAKWADVPVINMQCDIDHPCQSIADLMTIRERFGKNLRGLKIAISWAYTPTYAKPLSVPQGLITLMPRFGLDVVLAHPPEFKLMPEQIEIAKKNAADAGVKFEMTDSMEDAFKDADIVYPKSWGILELFGEPQKALEIGKKYKHWKCDEKKMELTKKHSIYMHCLPADRINEVTDAVIDGPHSVIYDEAENRLHTCKAIMGLTM